MGAITTIIRRTIITSEFFFFLLSSSFFLSLCLSPWLSTSSAWKKTEKQKNSLRYSCGVENTKYVNNKTDVFEGFSSREVRERLRFGKYIKAKTRLHLHRARWKRRRESESARALERERERKTRRSEGAENKIERRAKTCCFCFVTGMHSFELFFFIIMTYLFFLTLVH